MTTNHRNELRAAPIAIAIVLALLGLVSLSGCDASTGAVTAAAADSAAKANAGAPSDPLLGVWKHAKAANSDSIRGWAFTSTRYVRSYPLWVTVGSQPAKLHIEFEGGTWKRVGSTLIISPDSIGMARDTTYGSRCDGLGICWGEQHLKDETVPYSVQGDTLITWTHIYERVRK